MILVSSNLRVIVRVSSSLGLNWKILYMKLTNLYRTGPFKRFGVGPIQFGGEKRSTAVPTIRQWKPYNRGTSILGRKRTAP